MPSPLEPLAVRVASVRKSVLVSVGVPVSPVSVRPPPPRNPRPFTDTVLLPIVRVPATSMARMPPVDPFHVRAVSVELSVAVVYCGTRMTWKVRCP